MAWLTAKDAILCASLSNSEPTEIMCFHCICNHVCVCVFFHLLDSSFGSHFSFGVEIDRFMHHVEASSCLHKVASCCVCHCLVLVSF